MKRLKISFAVVFIASIVGFVATESPAYPPLLFKAKKFGAQDCTFCHVNPEGGPPWNERGKWLIQEKEKRNADQVDVEWLADYKGVNSGPEKSSAPPAFSSEAQPFVKLEQDWMKAVAAQDQEALKRLMSEDFTLTSAYSTGSLISREQFLENIKAVKQNELGFHDATVKIYGNVAVFKARIKDNYSMNGEDRSGDYLITDVWVKSGGQWQVVTRHSSIPVKQK